MTKQQQSERDVRIMMWIKETFINATKGYIFGDSGGWIETDSETVGELFRSLRREYGACVSKQYVDTVTRPVQTGWVFQKRMEYEDARESWKREDRTYLREVWVSVSATEPVRTVRTLNITNPWEKQQKGVAA